MSQFYSQAEHQPFQLGSGSVGALLLHGFPGTPAEMRPLGERLVAAGWSAYAPLLPGFGPEIPTLGEKTRHDWLDAARQAWQAVRAAQETAIVIGFSMGGALALNLAAKEKPDYLVLLAPFWRFGTWQARLLPLVKHFQKAFYPFAEADFSDLAVRQQLAGILPEIDLDDPEVQKRLRQEIQLPTAAIDEVRRLGIQGGRIAPSIKCPTLVLQGLDDELVRPRLSRQLVTRLGGPATYREIPGGHSFPKMESPEAHNITPDIISFVDDLAERG